MLIQDVMTPHVATCTQGNDLETVALLMKNNDCGSIPIVDADDKPVGMVTDRDILILSAQEHKPLWELTVDEIISKESHCSSCSYDDDIKLALALMERHSVRRLPITNREGQLIGILSMDDIVVATASPQPDSDTTFAHDYVWVALKVLSKSQPH